MSDTLTFSDRKEFRRWLEVNCLKSAGVFRRHDGRGQKKAHCLDSGQIE